MHARTLPLRSRNRQRAGSAATAVLLLLTAAGFLTACGGGGGSPPIPTAPSNLTYSDPLIVYRTDSPITPNVPTADGDPVDTWTCTPTLPSGLVMSSDGSIVGTPEAPAAAADYEVTATNGGGLTTAMVNIEVVWSEEKSLAPKVGITDADVRHFLDRTHFGFSQAHYDQINTSGLAAYVDAMTTFADTTALEDDAKTRYLIDTENDPEGLFPSESDLARYWLYMMMVNTNPFQENLAFKLHDHFATGTTVLGGSNRHYFINHINLWRHGGAGNLRQLLIDMTRDHAMLVWLDGISNNDGNANENFSREFFELFCLGVDIEYTQADIVEGARAFTGYRQRYDSNTSLNFIEFDHNRHDHGEKTVLGQTIPAQAEGDTETDDYEAMVDIVLTTNEAGTGVSRVGQWIIRSLLEYFCYPEPSQNVIDELANDLRAGGWELKPVLVKLFQSEAFFSAKAKAGFVKGPVEHITGFMRATSLVGDPGTIDNALRLMGHRPTQPPTVDGWPGGTQWLSAQGMVDRANLLNYLTEQAQNLQNGLGVTALDLLPTPAATSAETVDALTERLNVQVGATERTSLITYLDTERDSGGTVTPSPFDPVGNGGEAENRVRGLLWILAQHPTYQTR
jgi:uncharacterized protein (DUF1800 family)